MKIVVNATTKRVLPKVKDLPVGTTFHYGDGNICLVVRHIDGLGDDTGNFGVVDLVKSVFQADRGGEDAYVVDAHVVVDSVEVVL